MVTSLRRREIVIGKMLPYLVVSVVLVMVNLHGCFVNVGLKRIRCVRKGWKCECHCFFLQFVSMMRGLLLFPAYVPDAR